MEFGGKENILGVRFKAMFSNTEDICRHTQKDILCLSTCKCSLLGQTSEDCLQPLKSVKELTDAFSHSQTSFLLHFLSIMLTLYIF